MAKLLYVGRTDDNSSPNARSLFNRRTLQRASPAARIAARMHLYTHANQRGPTLKAAEANFLKFLKRSDQLEVPIYQRTYSWTRPECLQLWSDIVRASNGDVEGHFIGSIVYIDTGIYQVTGANAIELIDGQQRDRC
jgi:hypothetical protein